MSKSVRLVNGPIPTIVRILRHVGIEMNVHFSGISDHLPSPTIHSHNRSSWSNDMGKLVPLGETITPIP